MQPYFFPSVRYFALMHITDKWVFFDTPQFVRHSWMDRNRILKPEEGWQYFRVPLLSHHQKTPLNKIRIDNSRPWQQTLFSQFGHYKRIAPYYPDVMDLLNKLFSKEFHQLSDFNIESLKQICSYIGIDLQGDVYSRLNLDIQKVEKPDEWALNICKALNYDEYINALNGLSFFDRSKFEKHGISIKFLSYTNIPYSQKRQEFVPDLSILDLMMFLRPEEILEMLESYTLI
ncbi:MAG: WbqC family protein [bacterium]